MQQLRTLRGGSLGYSTTLIQHIGWRYNAVLTGLSFYVRDGVWHSVIKADFGNRPMVAFLNVGTFERVIEVTEEYASRGWLNWKEDRKPPKTRTMRKPPLVNRS